MTDYSDRVGNWIITFTGKRFYPLDPRKEDIDIIDIAHALALINRFTGHTEFPYSVGQHSLAVSRLIEPEFALDGLLHDATEAYVNDLSKPLKRDLPEYCRVEDAIHKVISSKFNVLTTRDEVKAADAQALVSEAVVLCNGEQWYFADHWPYPANYHIEELSWRSVECEFLDRFKELTGG